ncbi:hypothetical protein EVAR_48142_1 [Eumeta japonica]|uniref:Uncharacterized protein n=1 Tax=Eumeta variegata TaxID=151549 RepID=A0A4C2ABD6_EUMVA|nr:hypothetical protein EVAR_48142_1 [Eumeta japonica]
MRGPCCFLGEKTWLFHQCLPIGVTLLRLARPGSPPDHLFGVRQRMAIVIRCRFSFSGRRSCDHQHARCPWFPRVARTRIGALPAFRNDIPDVLSAAWAEGCGFWGGQHLSDDFESLKIDQPN